MNPTNEISLIMRNGPPVDIAMRRTLFSMAQIMIERKLETLSFEGAIRPFVATMVTELKPGYYRKISGMLFKAHIDYGEGVTLEMLFLAAYRPDWREACMDTLEFDPPDPPRTTNQILEKTLGPDWRN